MPQEYKLLKTQKNEVFKIIQEAGLEPANFSWAEHRKTVYWAGGRSEKTVPRLNYLDGDYYFQFEMSDKEHYCEFSPSIDKRVEHRDAGRSWNNVILNVQRWTDCLKREIEALDLWKEMGKYGATVSLTLPEQILNEPIPAYEAEQIADKLQQLAGKIEQQFELNDEQNKFVRNKLNYLAEAAKRQRSMDWVHTSIGVFVTIAMALELLPDKVKEFWQLVQSLFGEFIHLLGS